MLVALLLPSAGAAQVSDTVPVRLPGLRISVDRLVTDEAGAARILVPLDTLAPQIAPTLEDVLRATPLIRVRRNARGQAQPFLRGGDDRQVAVLVDGVPITLGYDHRADLSALPLSGARSLALTRGPAPLGFGPNVTLGAIEIDVAGGEGSVPAASGLRLAVTGSSPAGVRAEGRSGRRFGWGSRALDVRAGGSVVDRRGLAVAAGVEPSPWLEGPDGRRLGSDLRRAGAFASARLGDAGSSPGTGWIGITGLASEGERGVEPETHVETPRFWRYPEDSGWLLAGSAGTPAITTRLGPLAASVHAGLHGSELLIDEYASAEYDEAVEKYAETRRALVILPDSIRNYLSKFVSDEWLAAHGFTVPSPDEA